MSTDGWHVLTHPWAIFTHMFLHEQFLGHLFWNMIFLYWFGRILGDLIGDHHLLPTYLLSGLFAGACYFIAGNLLNIGIGDFALGASSPDHGVALPFIGMIRLKYIVAFFLLIYLTALANNDNSGGQIAHLAGALFGWFYIYRLRSGQDFSKPVNGIVNSLGDFFQGFGKSAPKEPKRKREAVFKKMNPRRASGRPNSVSDTEDFSHQEKLDAILEKIKKKGYDSLTDEEKDFLYNASKKD